MSANTSRAALATISSMNKSTLLALPTCLLSMHCTTVSSDAIRTQGIRLEAVATVTEGETSANLDLVFKSGSNFIELGSSDQIRCENRNLTRVTVLGITSYLVAVPKKSVGESYSCTFTRTGESYEIRVAQVAPVGQLSASTTWSTTSPDYVINIPNVANTTVQAVLSGSCLTRIELNDIPDGGELRFGTSALRLNESVAVGDTCTAQLEVIRKAEGGLPVGFQGGLTRSKQRFVQNVVVTR
jgi:hypothetical protein